MFKVFKRTEGVSTTDITGKLLALAEDSMKKDQQGHNGNQGSPNQNQKYEQPPKQQFLATSRRIINFANKNLPGPNDKIVYVSGSFDLLHHGHLKRLQEAKKLGDFLYVGIWDDDMTKYYKGSNYPIVSIQERVLMTLACKHVDDIVIGAPYILTKDLISSLNISTVVHVTDTDEDVVKEEFNDIDPFTVAKEMGIFKEIEIKDPFYNITTESIAQRVYNNQAAFMKKFQNKAAKEKQYYE